MAPEADITPSSGGTVRPPIAVDRGWRAPYHGDSVWPLPG